MYVLREQSDKEYISNSRKVAILLHTLGTKAQEIYETLDIPKEDKKEWETVIKQLENYFKQSIDFTNENKEKEMRYTYLLQTYSW